MAERRVSGKNWSFDVYIDEGEVAVAAYAVGEGCCAYLSADEARTLAAHLRMVADELTPTHPGAAAARQRLE